MKDLTARGRNVMDLTTCVFRDLKRQLIKGHLGYCDLRQESESVCPFVDLSGHGYCMAEALDAIRRIREALQTFVDAAQKLLRWTRRYGGELVDPTLHADLKRATTGLRKALREYARARDQSGRQEGEYWSASGDGGQTGPAAKMEGREFPPLPGCQDMHDALGGVVGALAELLSAYAVDAEIDIEPVKTCWSRAVQLSETLTDWADNLGEGAREDGKKFLFASPVPLPNDPDFEREFRKQLWGIASQSGLWRDTDLGSNPDVANPGDE